MPSWKKQTQRVEKDNMAIEDQALETRASSHRQACDELEAGGAAPPIQNIVVCVSDDDDDNDNADLSFQRDNHVPNDSSLSLQAWRKSGLVDKILQRPVERKTLLHSYRSLQKQQTRDYFEHRQQQQPLQQGLDWKVLQASQAIFVSSSEAGLGQEELVQSLRNRVGDKKNQPISSLLWLEIDCDRGSHCPDPHLPAIRSLSNWATQALVQAEESSNTRVNTFLTRFSQYLQQSLGPKERDFLTDQVPQLDAVFTQFGSTKLNHKWPEPALHDDKHNNNLARTTSSLRKSVLSFMSSPSTSSVSQRTATAVYSCQKQAILFHPAFCKFVYSLAKAAAAACTRQDEPAVLVVYFMNLHCGDEVLLHMLRHLLTAQDLRQYEYPYLFLTTYQQDPDNYMPACIDLAFDQFKRRQVVKTKISLQPLDVNVLTNRIKQAVRVPDTSSIDALIGGENSRASWLVQKRLEQCVADGSLVMDTATRLWKFRKTATIIRANKTPLELCELDQLSAKDLQFLRIVACLGKKTSRSILEKARASDALDEQLESAIQKGFLVQTNESEQEYTFVHEGLKDLIYHDIPIENRPKFHYQIAENLWVSFNMEELDNQIVLVSENLLSGKSQLPNKKRRAAVARLCLRTGELRAQVSAYFSAFYFFTSAIELISDCWEDEYPLCLALHCAACEVANCLGLSDDIFRLADTAINRARTFEDALRAHISKVYAIGSQGDCMGSLHYGASLLAQLGESVSLRPSRRQAMQHISRTYRRLRPMTTNEKILRLPPMENTEKVSAMRILNSMLPYTFNADYLMIAVVVDKMIELTLNYGTSALSGIAFALLAAVQCWVGDTASGQRFGNLALRLTEMYQVDAWIGRVATFYFSSIQTWRRPFQESLEPMRAARQTAMASGDVEFGMLNANLSCLIELDLVPIPRLVDAIRDYQEIMKKHRQAVNLQMLGPSLVILMSCAGDPQGDITLFEDAAEQFADVADATSLVAQWHHYARMLVAFLFNRLDESSRSSRLCSSLISNPAGSGDTAMPSLVDGLLALEICRRQRWKMPALVVRARRRIRQLRRFAAGSPSNFLGKLHLVQAELASVIGRNDRAHMYYMSSIALMREAGFNLQLGLANELAGKHFLRLRDDRAEQFFREADRVYRAWGGIAKANHLLEQLK